MALRTYGDKPLSFQLEENGEYYYVGSEVLYFFASYNPSKYMKTQHAFTFRSETICGCSADRYTKNIRACCDVH